MTPRPSPKDPSTSSRGTLMRAVLLVAAGALVYANGLSGPFVFDDYTAIQRNTQIRRVLPLSASLSPPLETPVAGRPLVNLSLAINYAMGGFDVRAYHVTNVAIHLLAALALFGVVRRTLELDPLGSMGTSSRDVAFVSALIWVLHPLQTEVVSYVTQRTTSLMALMFLLTLYCSIRAATSPGRRWPVAAVLSCAAGMACKEEMVTAPVVVLLYDRVFVSSSLREAFTRRGRLYAGLAGTWIILAALMVSSPRATVGLDAGVDPWTYLLNQTTLIVDYLRLTIWPAALVLDYGIPRPLTLGDVIVPALAVTGMGLATLVALARWPRIGFLGAWFFITLAPTSSVIPIVSEVGAERRTYLPLAAVIVLAVCGVFFAIAARRVPRAVAGAACAGVCIALGTGTILRNEVYRSPLALARADVERRPHGRAYLRYGSLLLEAGRRAEAIEYFRRARSAGAVGARFALGTEYLQEGDLDAGILELTEFVRRHPSHINAVPARELLGQAYHAQGRLEDAADQFTRILREVPNHGGARERLADVLLGQNRPADALPHLEYVAARRPGNVNALGKLGTALAASGRFEEAATVLSRAVAIDPRSSLARSMLGRTLAMQGRMAEAADQFQLAVELSPNDEAARRDLEEARRRLSGSTP
jgi:tetratricopeptide (TPR) repeat protein